MKTATFRALRVGDPVTLAAPLPTRYDSFFLRKGFPATIPAGTVGIVGAANVPAVRVNRAFACVDFPDLPVHYWSASDEPLTTIPRVAAYAEELK